jgi:hypothetical protein
MSFTGTCVALLACISGRKGSRYQGVAENKEKMKFLSTINRILARAF